MDRVDDKEKRPPDDATSRIDSSGGLSEKNKETPKVNVEETKLLPQVDANESELKDCSKGHDEENEATPEVNVEDEKLLDVGESDLKDGSRDHREINEEKTEDKKDLPPDDDTGESEENKQHDGDAGDSGLDSLRDQPDKNRQTSEVNMEQKRLPVDEGESELKDQLEQSEEGPKPQEEDNISREETNKTEETLEVNVERKRLLPDGDVDDNDAEERAPPGDDLGESECKDSSRILTEKNGEISRVNLEEEKQDDTSGSSKKDHVGIHQEKNEETSIPGLKASSICETKENKETEVNEISEKLPHEVDASESELKDSSQVDVNEEKLSTQIDVVESELKDSSQVDVNQEKLPTQIDVVESELKDSFSCLSENHVVPSQVGSSGQQDNDNSNSDAKGISIEESSSEGSSPASGTVAKSCTTTNFSKAEEITGDCQTESNKKEPTCESQGFSVGAIFTEQENPGTTDSDPEGNGKPAESVCESQGFSVGNVHNDIANQIESESQSEPPFNSVEEPKSPISTNVDSLVEVERQSVLKELDSNSPNKQNEDICSKGALDERVNTVEKLKQNVELELETSEAKGHGAVKPKVNSENQICDSIHSIQTDIKTNPAVESSMRSKCLATGGTENNVDKSTGFEETEQEISNQQTPGECRTAICKDVKGAETEVKSLLNQGNTEEELSKRDVHHDETSGTQSHVECKDVEDNQMQIKISAVCSLSVENTQVDGCSHQESSSMPSGNNQFLGMNDLEKDNPGLFIGGVQGLTKPVKDCSDESFEWKGKQSPQKVKSPEKGNVSIGYSEKNNQYKCKLCNEVGNGTSFEEHIMQHILWKPYKCLYCGQFFITRADIGKHVADAHNGKSLKCGLRAIKKAREFMKTAKKDGDYNYFSQKLNDMYWSCRQNETLAEVNDEKINSPDKPEDIPADDAQVNTPPDEAARVPVNDAQMNAPSDELAAVDDAQVNTPPDEAARVPVNDAQMNAPSDELAAVDDAQVNTPPDEAARVPVNDAQVNTPPDEAARVPVNDAQVITPPNEAARVPVNDAQMNAPSDELAAVDDTQVNPPPDEAARVPVNDAQVNTPPDEAARVPVNDAQMNAPPDEAARVPVNDAQMNTPSDELAAVDDVKVYTPPDKAAGVPVNEEKHDHASTYESSGISNEIQPRSHDFAKQLSRPDITKLIAMYKETDVKTAGDKEANSDQSQVEIEVQVEELKNQNRNDKMHKDSRNQPVSNPEPIELLYSATENLGQNLATVKNTEAKLVLPKGSSSRSQAPCPMSKSEIAKNNNQLEPIVILDSPTEDIVLKSILSNDSTPKTKQPRLEPKDRSTTASQASQLDMKRGSFSASEFQVISSKVQAPALNQVKLMSPPLQKATPLSPPILVPVSVSPIVYSTVLQNSYGNNLQTKPPVINSHTNTTTVRLSTPVPPSNVVTFIPGQQMVQNIQFLPQNIAPVPSNAPPPIIGQNCAYRLFYIPNQPLQAHAPVASDKQATPKTSSQDKQESITSLRTDQQVLEPSVAQKEIIGVDVKASSAPKIFPKVFSIGCVKQNFVCCACKCKYKQESTFRGHLWNHLHPDCKPCEMCKQKDGGNGRKIIACETTDGYIESLRTNKFDETSHVEVKLSVTEKLLGASEVPMEQFDARSPPQALPEHSKQSVQLEGKTSSATVPVTGGSCNSSKDHLSNMRGINTPTLRAHVSGIQNNMPVSADELASGSKDTSDECNAVIDSNRKESVTEVTSDAPGVLKPASSNRPKTKEPIKPSRPSTKWHFYVCGAYCGYSSLYSNDFKKHIINCPMRNSLSCAHCQYFADTPDGMMRHLTKHYVAHAPSIALHSCFVPTCGFRTNILQGFHQHVTACHPDPQRYVCSNCKDVFGSLDLLIEHLQRNILHVVSCKHCSAKDLTKSVIISHIKESHSDKARMTTMVKQLLCKDRKDNEETLGNQTLSVPHFSADTIDPVAGNVDQVELEIDRVVSPEPEQDSDHGKQGPDQENVSSEILPLSVDPVFECCVCSYVGVDQKDLNTHMPKHAVSSATNTLAFSCPECPEEFNLVTSFEKHLKKHEKHLRYEICSCLICKMNIGSREEIERHIKAMHQMVIGSGREFVGLTLKVSNPDVFKCPDCSYKCLGKSTLEEHLQRHKDGKLVPKINPENTPQKQSVVLEQEKTVMKISSSNVYVKPLKCIKCSYSSAFKSNILKHVSNSHPEVKIVQLYNGVTSPTRASAQPESENTRQSEESLKIGSGVLDTELEWLYENHCTFYRCLFCLKEITKKNLLHNHLLDHLQISLWKCPLCDFKTSRRIVISDHVKEVHKAEQSVEGIIPLIDEIQTEVKRVLGDLKGRSGLLEHMKPPLGTKEMDEELKQQYKRIGNKKRICKVCDAEYQSFYAIHSHILRKHIKQLLFSCSYCEFSAIDRFSVAKHLADKHPSRIKVVVYSPAKIRKKSCKNGKPASNCEETSRKQKVVPESVSGGLASTSRVSEEPTNKQNDDNAVAPAGDESSRKQSFHLLADDKHCGIRIGSDSLHQRLIGLYTLKKGKSKIFMCKTCPLEFVSRYTLHSHLLRHLEVNLVGCPYCELEAIDKKDVADHISNVHEGHKVTFQLLRVDLDVVCKTYLQSHQLQLSKEEQSPSKSRPSLAQLITGRKTKLTSPKKSPLKSPEKQHINILCITKGSLKKFKCRLCDYMALTKSSVQRHLIQNHGNDEKDKVKIVAKKSTLPEKMTCNFCSFSSTMAEVLRSHYKDKHPQNIAVQEEEGSRCTSKTTEGHPINPPESEISHRRKSRETKEKQVQGLATNIAQTTVKDKEKEDQSKMNDTEQDEEMVKDVSDVVKLRKRKEISIHGSTKDTAACKKMKLDSEEHYQCTKCPFNDTKDEAVKHLEAEHGIKRLMQCGYCDARFFFIDTLKSHISFLHKGNDLKFKRLPLELMLEKVEKETEKQESTESVKETKITKPAESGEPDAGSCSPSHSPGSSNKIPTIKTKKILGSSSIPQPKDTPKNVVQPKSIAKSNNCQIQDSGSGANQSANETPVRKSNLDNKRKRSRKTGERDKLEKPTKGQEVKGKKVETDDSSEKTSTEMKTKEGERGQIQGDITTEQTPEDNSTVLPAYVPSSPDNSEDEQGEYYSYLCVYCDYKVNKRSDMKLHLADFQIKKFFKGVKPTSDEDIKKIKMKVRDILPICSSRAKNKKEKCPGVEGSAKSVKAGVEGSAKSVKAGVEGSAKSVKAGVEGSAKSVKAGVEGSAKSVKAGVEGSAKSVKAGVEGSAKSVKAGVEGSAKSVKAGVEGFAKSVKADEPSVSKQKLSKEDSSVGKNAVSQGPCKKKKTVSASTITEKKGLNKAVSQVPCKKKKTVSATTITEKKGLNNPKDIDKESAKEKIYNNPLANINVTANKKLSTLPKPKQKVSSFPKEVEKPLSKQNVVSCQKINEKESTKQKTVKDNSIMTQERQDLPATVKKEKVTPKKVNPKQLGNSEDESDSDIEIRRKRPKKSNIKRRFLSSSDEESEGERAPGSKKHIVSPSGGRLTYCCHVCSYKAKSLYNFRLHLATHGTFTHLNADMSGASWLRCGFCDFLAESKEEFSKHVEKHLDGRIYKCGYCKYDSYHSKNMKSHLKNKHRHKPVKIIHLRDLLKEKAQRPGSVAQLVNLDPELRLVDSLQNFSDILEEAGLKTLDMPLSMLPFLKQEDKQNIPMQIEYEDDEIIIDNEDDEDYVIVDETEETDSDNAESDDEDSEDDESANEDELVFVH